MQLGSKEDSLVNSARVLELVFILRNVKATCKPLGPGVPLLASLSFLLNWFLSFFRLGLWEGSRPVCQIFLLGLRLPDFCFCLFPLKIQTVYLLTSFSLLFREECDRK